MRYLPGMWLLVAVLSVAAPSARHSAPSVSEVAGRMVPENSSQRVEDSIQSTSSATLDRLIEEYRHGDAAAAMEEFARWDAKRVEAALASWDTLRAASTFELTQMHIRPIAALVMLHTSAALQRDMFGISGRVVPSGTPNHYQAAHRLVKMLADRAREESATGLPAADRIGVRTFCRNWFVLATAMWMSAWQCEKAADAAGSGLASLGDDAQLLLAAGSVAEVRAVHERMALTGTCGSPWSMTSNHGSFVTSKRTLDDARAFLQRALALDGSLAEARLHLGRVFYWGDSSDDAVRELERAIADAPDADRAFIGYLAALFLGRVHEEAHRGPEARRAYQRAIELNPRGYVAHLALGHLLIMSGQVDDGWASVRAAFGDQGNKTSGELDPWATYRDAQTWRAARLAREMDAWVRE